MNLVSIFPILCKIEKLKVKIPMLLTKFFRNSHAILVINDGFNPNWFIIE